MCRPATSARWERDHRHPSLEAIAGSPAIVIGEVAGALHGWPLVLSGTGTVQVVAHQTELPTKRRARAITEQHPIDTERDAPLATRNRHYVRFLTHRTAP